jgi:hypothetical protein
MNTEQFFSILMTADKIDDPNDKARFLKHCQVVFPNVAGEMWGQMVFTRMAKLLDLSPERFIEIVGPPMRNLFDYSH